MERPGEPTGDARVRPVQAATCSFDAAELSRRLLNLFQIRDGDALNVDVIERVVGTPRLRTMTDDARVAGYAVIIEAAPGFGGWKMMLTFTEGFWPALETRPARFRGTLRPVLIDPRERGERSIDAKWLGPDQPPPDEPACLAAEALTAAARRRGWRAQPPVTIASAHGHGEFVWQFVFERRDLTLSAALGEGRACIADLRLAAPADPPVPPITDEEDAGLRLARAQVVERKLLKLPAQGRDDENARNAFAKFYRDAQVRGEAPQPDPLKSQIAGLTTEQLRDALERIVTGSLWGLAHEDCEAAIAEAEPPAALRRRAKLCGLSDIDLRALETFCTAYIQGRRFKPAEREPK